MAQKINSTFDNCTWKDYLASQQSRLVPLPDIEHVSSRVIRILAGNPGEVNIYATLFFLLQFGHDNLNFSQHSY